MPLSRSSGFTLAELLISLAILGVITTFTIPKVLQAQQGGQNNAAAHEAASMLAGAYSLYTLNNTLTTNVTLGDLTPYMNYVSVPTSGQLDDIPTSNAVYDCATPGFKCLKLHNGGTLIYATAYSFGGTSTTHMLFALFDPDSSRVGVSADGPSKTVSLILFYNGRVSSFGKIPNGTNSTGGNYGTGVDPSWFQW